MRKFEAVVKERAGILILLGSEYGMWIGPHGVKKIPSNNPMREALEKTNRLMMEIIRNPAKTLTIPRAEQAAKPLIRQLRTHFPLPPKYAETWRVFVLFGGGDGGGYLIDSQGHLHPIPPFPADAATSVNTLQSLLTTAPGGTLSLHEAQVARAVQTIQQTVTTMDLEMAPA